MVKKRRYSQIRVRTLIIYREVVINCEVGTLLKKEEREYIAKNVGGVTVIMIKRSTKVEKYSVRITENKRYWKLKIEKLWITRYLKVFASISYEPHVFGMILVMFLLKSRN